VIARAAIVRRGTVIPVSRASNDQVALVWVAAEIGSDEGTHRGDVEAARADVVERATDEAAADAVLFRRGFDLGMQKDDHARRGAVPDPADDLLPVVESLVAELRWVVANHVFVGHSRHGVEATAVVSIALSGMRT
jgi:hypothetical protein